MYLRASSFFLVYVFFQSVFFGIGFLLSVEFSTLQKFEYVLVALSYITFASLISSNFCISVIKSNDLIQIRNFFFFVGPVLLLVLMLATEIPLLHSKNLEIDRVVFREKYFVIPYIMLPAINLLYVTTLYIIFLRQMNNKTNYIILIFTVFVISLTGFRGQIVVPILYFLFFYCFASMEKTKLRPRILGLVQLRIIFLGCIGIVAVGALLVYISSARMSNPASLLDVVVTILDRIFIENVRLNFVRYTGDGVHSGLWGYTWLVDFGSLLGFFEKSYQQILSNHDTLTMTSPFYAELKANFANVTALVSLFFYLLPLSVMAITGFLFRALSNTIPHYHNLFALFSSTLFLLLFPNIGHEGFSKIFLVVLPKSLISFMVLFTFYYTWTSFKRMLT